MQIHGIQLQVGDTVMTDQGTVTPGKWKIDEVLTEFEGQCSNGLHFRTKRGSHVCYDKCALLVIAA